MIPETAIQAAATVLWETDPTTLGVTAPTTREEWDTETEGYIEDATAALEAALPHLEAALRTQIAADIQAMYPEMSHHVLITERRQALYDGMREAVRIVEEGNNL